MAVVAAIAVGAIALGAIVVGAIMMSNNIKTNKMAPVGLDKFEITQCTEGEAIPLIWGTIKCASNVLWYGNLVSKKKKAEGGGKGAGEKPVVGYQYFLDIWLGLCWCPNGSTTLLTAYSQDKEIKLSGLGTYYLNPGNGSFYPHSPGPYATKLKGMAHLYLDRFDVGVNTTFIPNISFVIKTTSSAPLNNANMTTGVNPAAIIYDLLIMAEVVSADIDLASFQSAATYWYQKDYGLNLMLSSQTSIEEYIAKLQTYVDFTLYQDNNGKWVLKPHKSTDTSVATIDTEDFRDFVFTTQTWDSTTNDFRATFIDKDLDYTQRVLTYDNVASIDLIGNRVQKALDFTAFISADVASKRLAEMMKRYSYPISQITCSVPYRYIVLNIGDVVSINNADFGIVARDYRILSIEETDDSNYVKLTLQEMIENKFDPNYYIAGESLWEPLDTDPKSAAYSHIFELPYTETFSNKQTLLFLCQRKSIENGFSVYQAPYGSTNFKFIKNLSTFSTRCLLAEKYEANTFTIDEDGVYIIPYRLDPEWVSVSRQELFDTTRILIMGDEICTFQSIQPVGAPYPAGTYKLTDVCRGVLGTPITAHNVNTEAWITEIDDNIITGITFSKAAFKFVPFSANVDADISTCPVVNIALAQKANTPLPVSRIKVVRSGTTCSVVVCASVYNIGKFDNSAGAKAAESQMDLPYSVGGAVLGKLQYKIGGGTWTDATNEQDFSYNQAGVHILYVRYNNNNLLSLEKSVSVGSTNDTYIGPND